MDFQTCILVVLLCVLNCSFLSKAQGVQSSCSGATALTGFDEFNAGLFLASDSLLHCKIMPLAYGNLQLSESALLANIRAINLPLFLYAQSAGGWVHSTVSSSVSWQPAQRLWLTLQPTFGLQYAYSFAASVHTDLKLLANVVIDSGYAMAVSINGIRAFGNSRFKQTATIAAALSYSSLQYNLSADVILEPMQRTQLLVQAVIPVMVVVTIKTIVGTNPVTLGCHVQLNYSEFTTLTCGFEHTQHLGLRSAFTVAFLP